MNQVKLYVKTADYTYRGSNRSSQNFHRFASGPILLAVTEVQRWGMTTFSLVLPDQQKEQNFFHSHFSRLFHNLFPLLYRSYHRFSFLLKFFDGLAELTYCLFWFISIVSPQSPYLKTRFHVQQNICVKTGDAPFFLAHFISLTNASNLYFYKNNFLGEDFFQ